MWYEDFSWWAPTLAVLVGVLFVNFFIPVRTRLDHSLATAICAAVVWCAWAWVSNVNLILFQMSFLVLVMFIADSIGTFISFTNRIRNAIATVVVFVPLYFGLAIGISFVLFGFRPRGL
jgi:hypothetical protein